MGLMSFIRTHSHLHWLCEPVRWAAQSWVSSNDWSRFVDSHKMQNAHWMACCAPLRPDAIIRTMGPAGRGGDNDTIWMHDKSNQLLLLLGDWIHNLRIGKQYYWNSWHAIALVCWPFVAIACANYCCDSWQIKISTIIRLIEWCEPLWNTLK